jgi:hypothetical protein
LLQGFQKISWILGRKQTDVIKIICYKNQEQVILALNLGMRLIGWSGDFYGLRIFTVSYWG